MKITPGHTCQALSSEPALPKHSPRDYLVMVNDLKHGFKSGTLSSPEPWKKPPPALQVTQPRAGFSDDSALTPFFLLPFLFFPLWSVCSRVCKRSTVGVGHPLIAIVVFCLFACCFCFFVFFGDRAFH